MGSDLSELAVAELVDLPPRICGYGPCRHHHTIEIVMDAATPAAGEVLPGGSLAGVPALGAIHLERQHYCYPDVGIEIDLGNTPVVTCNRWRPPLLAIGVRRRHKRDLGDWHIRQIVILTQTARADDDAAEALADAEAARAAETSTTPSTEGTPSA